jgi:hypothetical protein
MGAMAWTRGKGLRQNRRGIRGDHSRDGAVFVSVCLEEMTSGPSCQRPMGEEKVTVREGKETGRGLDSAAG